MTPGDEALLDNPVYAALCGPHARFAQVRGADERFRLDGWTEISAVCTKPDHRGQGLASLLVRALAARIQLGSQRVFLHVLATNTAAIRLYEELGFRTRQTTTISVVTRYG
jgi:predicted GNAT family acetyltransferase